MAAVNVTVTNSYTQVAAGVATMTVKNIGGGAILFSDNNADDSTAIPAQRSEGPQQFVQTADVPTYARHTGKPGEDWQIIVDDNV